jgi:MFS family permease
MTVSAPSPRPSTPRHRTTVATAVLLVANFTLAIDFSILNVALPHIGAELRIPTSQLQWIATAFAVSAAGLTLLFGRAADLFGRRRLLLLGLTVLGAGSLLGGLAASFELLLVARVAQGLATAAVTPAALSLLTAIYEEGPRRSRILGVNGALMAAGFTAGAVLGGVLTGAVSWRSTFFLNVVVAAVALCLAPWAIRELRAERRPRLDVWGAAFVTSGLMALVLGVTNAGERGWGDPWAWGPLAVAVALIAGLVIVEAHVPEPLLTLSLLRRRPVIWGNVAGIIAFATETSLVFLITLYLQDVLRFNAVSAGLALAVLGLGTVLGGFAAPLVIKRWGSTSAIVTGLAVQAAATMPLMVLGAAELWAIPLLLLAFAGGVANLVAIVGFTVTATSGVVEHEQGLATGLLTMSQQIGIALGTPIMSAIVASSFARGLLPSLTTAMTVNGLIAGLSAVALAVLLGRRPSPALRPSAPSTRPERVERGSM